MKDSLRPQRLEDYFGQDHIKDQLNAAIFSAKERKVPLGHVLLSGPPGLGKTTLAMIIASEMKWGIEDILGSTAGNPVALSKRLMYLPENTILFIDEVHALRKPVQEVLYPVLEDNRLLYKLGDIASSFDLSPLTVIGATTDLGKLAQPFIDRFQLQFELHFYYEDELMDIAKMTAVRMGMAIPEAALEVIAERSRGTPRYANNFLKWVRDFHLFEDEQVTTAYVRQVMWKRLKIDSLGLRPLDRAYLKVLEAAEKPVGLEAIAAGLRQADVTLENTVEPYLMYRGLISRQGNGRIILEEGRKHLKTAQFRRVLRRR